jgi:ubiquitin carboxyl-terminal hydrolase 7
MLTQAQIPPGLKQRWERIQEEKRRKKQEKAEEYLHVRIKIATELDMLRHQDFDLANFANVRSFRVRKDSTLAQLKRRLAVRIGVPPERQRLWVWLSRQNKTYRPDFPLTWDDEVKPISESRARDYFLEIAEKTPLPQAPNTLVEGDWRAYFKEHKEESLLLFFKFYDHVKCRMEYVGHHIAPLHTRVADLMPVLWHLRGLPLGTPLLLFEEVRPSMVNSLRPFLTLRQEELTNGDIIIFQRHVSVQDAAKTNWPDVVQFCSYLHTRIQITFIPLPAAAAQGYDKPVRLDLNQKMFYDQVTSRLAEAIGVVQHLRIRLYGYSFTVDGPSSSPLRRDHKTELQELLNLRSGATNVTVYFEVLDFAVTELEHKRQFRVAWQTPKSDIAGIHSLLVPKEATVAVLIDALRNVIPPAHVPTPPPSNGDTPPPVANGSAANGNGERRIRLFEVTSGGRIERVLREDALISTLPETSFTRLHAEECAPEEASLKVRLLPALVLHNG